jgi:hypothetical protein
MFAMYAAWCGFSWRNDAMLNPISFLRSRAHCIVLMMELRRSKGVSNHEHHSCASPMHGPDRKYISGADAERKMATPCNE